MKLKLLFVALLLPTLLVQSWSGTAWAVVGPEVRDIAKVKEIAGEFICNCGCNKGLAVCEMTCGQEKRGFIQKQLDAGKKKPEIIQIMKTTFGSEILAAPEKKGFHWVAWITPFAVFFFGWVLVIKVVRTWVARRREDEGDGGSDNTPAPADHRFADRINKELKDFGW